MIATLERRTLYQYWRWVPVIAWIGVIYFLSSRSKLPRPEPISADFEAIAGHFIAYGILALLVSFALSETGLSSTRRAVCAVLFAVAYGLTDEFHQSFVPGRDPALFDIAMDAIGAITALVGWQFASRWCRAGRGTD